MSRPSASPGAVPALFALCVLAGCGGEPAGPDDPPDPGPPARVVIEPGALLLTAAGETMQLEARVYDAAGRIVPAGVTWQSNDPGTVSVSSGGLATATASLGSAQITAVVGGVESEPALALVARPAAGVVLIPDSQILSDPAAVDPDADDGPGWRYRIRVKEISPEAGQVVIGTGGRSLAGRVVGATAQGTETELTVEFMALNELFSDLQIDETIPLVEMETGTGGSSRRATESRGHAAEFGAADTTFMLGRFKCKATAKVPPLGLPTPTLKIDPDLSLALGYANGLKKYAVVGTITAEFGFKPVINATFEGKIGCETVLKTVTVPLGGVLAWFVGIQVPLGVGFELDGKLEIAEVGFDVTAHAEATAELGLLCPAGGGACSGLTSFDAQRDFDFKLIAPDLTEQLKLALGARAFVFARPSVGSAFSDKAQFGFLEATAGLRQSVDLASATRQAQETDYASGFKLEGQIDVGPGKDITSAIEKLSKRLGIKLSIDLKLVDVDVTLAESPKGTFTITPASVQPGDGTALGELATFTVELDPVTYLGIEAVDKVEVFWKQDDGNGGFTLEPGRPGCTDISGSSGQTTFECQTDFLEEHIGEQTFHAFVHARMFGVPIPIPLEIAADAAATVAVAVAAECPAPPDWAVPGILVEPTIEVEADSIGTATLTTTVDYNRISVQADAGSTFDRDSWVEASASIDITDYIKVIPLQGWPESGSVYLQTRVHGSAQGTRTHTYDDGRAQGRLWGTAFGADTTGNTYLEQDEQVDEVTREEVFRPGDTFDWHGVSGSIVVRARVAGYRRTASASLDLRLDVIGADDGRGNPVSVKVCSASGTQYWGNPSPPSVATRPRGVFPTPGPDPGIRVRRD